LDFGGEVMVLPAGVTQVCDLYLEALGQSTFSIIKRNLMLEVFKQFLYSLFRLNCVLLFGSRLLLLLLLALLLFVCL
jgi:hypothetical protein